MLNGEGKERGGEEKCAGDDFPAVRVGLFSPEETRDGLAVPDPRELSCRAVTPTYFDAREPGVMMF